MKSKLDDAWCEKLQNHNDSKKTQHNSLLVMMSTPQTENSLSLSVIIT